jgi:hypothetical protein
MLLKTKKHQPNELSILVFRDGFSFCTLERSVFYGLKTSDDLNLQSITSFLDEEKLPTDLVHVIHSDTSAVIIPQEMFDENNASFYLSKGVTLKKGEQIGYDVLESFSQVVLYPEPIKVMEVLKELFPTLQSKHLASQLLAPITKYSMGTPKKQLFVNIRKGAFDLFLFQGSQLLFFNSFEQNNVDEFLYYLFYITEQFYLNPDNFKLAFLGEYECYKEYYEGVQIFQNDIIYLDAPSENKSSTHPIPFIENKFA